ncbi:MAG TPA: DUF4190 domain-containing protein [Armatimonadota bacterium]|nr:DUF4190 domain-containing protein [Armatimonadota bacterium]
MANKQCPHCGEEYAATGITTICSRCLKPLDKPPAPAKTSRPAPAVPSSDRTPCAKCGEPLYATETTCWKCGTAQARAVPSMPVPPTTPGPTVAPPPVTPGAEAAPPPTTPLPPPPAPPPSPYAQTIYADGIDPAVEKRGQVSLILGIIGMAIALAGTCCGPLSLLSLVLGPAAIATGVSARRDGAGGSATAGMVLGIITVVLLLLGIAVFAAFIGLSVVAPTTVNPVPTPTP